jgi:hypothetical protein
MSDKSIIKKFSALDAEEKAAFKDGLSTYLGYLAEAKETRDAMKDQVSLTAKKVPSLSKKDVKKFFNYFKKGVDPAELKEDASILAEMHEVMGDGESEEEDEE